MAPRNIVGDKRRRDLWVEGDEKLVEALESLPAKTESRILRVSVASALKPIRTKMIELLRDNRRTGLLARSIATQVTLHRRTHTAVGKVGPKVGKTVVRTLKRTIQGRTFRFKIKINPEKYAHLVEYGTQPHSLGKGTRLRQGIDTGGRQHPGAKAKPFMRPAAAARKDDAVRVLNERIWHGIMKEAQRG